MRVTWLIHLLRVSLSTRCITCSTCDMTHSPTTRAIVNTSETHLVENGTRSRWKSHVTHMNVYFACVYECIHMCDKTWSSTARALTLSTRCATRSTCDMTHSHLTYDSSFTRDISQTHRTYDSSCTCDIPHSHMGQDSFSHLTWLIHVWHLTWLIRVWQDSFTHVT